MEQLSIEGRAYLAQARQALRGPMRFSSPGAALDDIARARDAMHEAATRYAELKTIEDSDRDIPF